MNGTQSFGRFGAVVCGFWDGLVAARATLAGYLHHSASDHQVIECVPYSGVTLSVSQLAQQCQQRPRRCDSPVPLRGNRGVDKLGQAGCRIAGGGCVVVVLRREESEEVGTGLCVDCHAVPYSAGRPRCAACHAHYIDPTNPNGDQPT